ncbi:MAG: hypothetical protein ABUK18_04040 [Candidatus Bathyarchaeia archaeon]|jgi:hypothetical protein
MTEKIDLNEMKQQANKLLTQDGLMELLMGAILFISSASFSGTVVLTPFLGLYVVFLNRILEGFRTRFTYPRIGYVKLPDDYSKEIGYGILTFVGAVSVALGAFIYVSYGTISGNLIYKWMPTLMGLILFGGLQYNLSKTGDTTNYIYIFAALGGGLAFSLKNFAEPKLGLQLYLLTMSGVFIVAGVVRFKVFIQRHSVREASGDE